MKNIGFFAGLGQCPSGIQVLLILTKLLFLKRGSRVVKALTSCARGPGFDPRRRRGKFAGPNTLPFVSFAAHLFCILPKRGLAFHHTVS